MREISLDTETTGLDPASGHRVVEIGCVEMVNRIKTGEVFHVYLNPDRDMPEEAFKVHGLSADFLKDKPRFTEKAEEFLAFISDSPLVIHNAGFDMKFINAELVKAGREALDFARATDTVLMARKKFPGSPANLDALCKRFEIDLSARTKHGALLDAELLADVYLELTGGRQSRLTLKVEQEEESVLLNMVGLSKEVRPARSFPASAEELASHQAFIAKLTKALWLKESA